MDTVIKPESQADIWDNKITKLSNWFSQEDALLQVKKHTGLCLKYVLEENASIAAHLELEINELNFNNRNDSTSVSVLTRLNGTDTGMIEGAINCASVYWSKTAILVAPEFSISELNTIGWLNANSSANVRFYAFKVEAWKNDDDISGELTLLAKPEDAMFNEIQSDFWTALANYELKKRRSEDPEEQYINPRYLSNSNTIQIGHLNSPCKGIGIFDPKNNTIGFGARIVKSDAEKYHNAFQQLKDEIESAFPTDIKIQYTFKPPYDIWTKLEGADLYNRAKWEEYFDWILQTLDIFHEILPPFIKEARRR